MTDTASSFETPSAENRVFSAREDTGIDVDMRRLMLMLWRRKMAIISTVLIGLSIATIAMAFIQPRYTARSLLLVQTENNKRFSQEIQTLMGVAKLDTTLILSEIEVLRSRTLARKVIERLNLMVDPEFNPRFRQQIAENNAAQNAPADKAVADTAGFKNLSVYGDELQSLPPEVVDRDIAGVVTRFLDGLHVNSIPGSYAIQVEYTSRDPNKAALITNALVDTYLEQQLEDKFKATKKVTDWLDKRLSDLRTQVRNTERAVEEYKAQNNLVEGARTVVSGEQLSALNSQLVSAKAKKAEAEARYQQIQELLKSPEKLETAPDIVNSSLIERLKLDQVKLEGQLSELLTRYGERHPEIQKARSELQDLRRTIHSEILKASSGAESELRFANARVKALEEGLQEVSGQRYTDNSAMIKLRELEREAQSTQLIYDTFLQTYKRSDNQEELQEAGARIISYAIVPQRPSYPNRMLFISLSLALSLFVGLGIAIILEKLDNTFRSASQLENTVGFPCFAMIPAIERMSHPELGRYILTKPASTLAEAVRTLRMVLNLRSRRKDRKTKVVTITSSFPSEGKTTLSLWMGRLAAKSGEKVLIIDADLRRPNIHRSAGMENEATLVDYLTGQSTLEQVIKKDDASGVHMIFGRSVPNSALDLLCSDKFKTLVESLRQVYDLVIIDSPACLAVSDARALATLSDQTLYAVAWDRTPREVVISGVKQFYDMGYRDIAFVLTHVDVKRHVKYGYGDTVYYYGRYKEYYAT